MFIAKENYKPGDIIASSLPFIYVLANAQRGTRCDSCIQPHPNLKRCANCLTVAYCGKQCQKQDWKQYHKHGECEVYRRAKELDVNIFSSENEQLSIRIYLTLMAKPQLADETFELADNTKRCFKDLVSNTEAMAQDEKVMGQFSGFVHRLELVYSGPFKLDQMMEIYGKVRTNCFSFGDGDFAMEKLGTGIYMNSSKFNHSCYPNAGVTRGFCQKVRVEEPIKLGEEVFISYVSTDRPRQLRRQALASYYFECKCKRCMSRDDRGPPGSCDMQ